MNYCQVSEVVEKNREEEQRLRKDKTRMESTLNATIAKYDEDMASRSKTLQVRHSLQAHRRMKIDYTGRRVRLWLYFWCWQDLKMWYEDEAKEFAALKEHFDKIDADITRSVEEESILRAVARRLG